MSNRFIIAAAAIAVLAIPAIARNGVESGINVGDMVSVMHPTHLSGPDKGTDKCPPCTYGNRPAVQVWLSPMSSEETVNAFAKTVSKAVKTHKKSEFKGFLINLTRCDSCVGKAETIAKGFKYDNIAYATIATDNKAVESYKVNTGADVKNTVFVYKDKKVVAKFVNLKMDKYGIEKLNKAIEKATL